MIVIQSAVKCFVAASEKERGWGWRKFSFLVPEENSGEAIREAPDTWSGQESCLTPPGTPHDQHLLTGLHGLCAGAFGFDSSPGLGQWPSVTHACWLFADFGPFSSQTVVCVCVCFTEFPLVFSRYSARLKEQGYCLKVSWICSRSGASCLRLSRGGLYQGFMCVWTRVHCTDASEIPEQYKAWCVGIRQKPVESGDEMSAAATTAAIQLETDNTFAQHYAQTLFKSQ